MDQKLSDFKEDVEALAKQYWKEGKVKVSIIDANHVWSAYHIKITITF